MDLGGGGQQTWPELEVGSAQVCDVRTHLIRLSYVFLKGRTQAAQTTGMPGDFCPVSPESLGASRRFLPALAHQVSSRTRACERRARVVKEARSGSLKMAELSGVCRVVPAVCQRRPV